MHLGLPRLHDHNAQVFTRHTAAWVPTAPSPQQLAVCSAYLEATGEGCTASTSMPIHLTSGAKLMANMLSIALVAAYVTAKGLGITALALLVYTKQPFRPSLVCREAGEGGGPQQWDKLDKGRIGIVWFTHGQP